MPLSIWARALLPLTLWAPSACADAEGRYDDFARRAADVGYDGGIPEPGGPCVAPEPMTLSGPALIAVETTLGAGLPILFFGRASTPDLGGVTHVALEYRALDASDRRTPVGPELSAGPFPIAADGTFLAEMPEDTLDGSANPILPGVPITSQLTLSARICGVRSFYCGTVTGRVTDPVRGNLTGRFGLTLLAIGESLPLQPRYGCDAKDVAPPL